MTTIDYDNFIRGQTILQSDTSDHSDALKLLHLWTFKTPIFSIKNLNDLYEEFILSKN